MAHFELVERLAPNAVIKVIGVGGGGGNAVAHMVSSSVEGVEFVTANTDSQAIKQSGAKQQLQLGGNVTKGLGAGANPEVGRQAALEDRETIINALTGADMVFITAGMVLTGGSSRMEGVVELAEEMLHMPVRVGIPQHVSGLGEVVGNPVHATGVGLLLWGSQLEHPHRPRINTGKAGTIFNKLRNWYRGEF